MSVLIQSSTFPVTNERDFAQALVAHVSSVCTDSVSAGPWLLDAGHYTLGPPDFGPTAVPEGALWSLRLAAAVASLVGTAGAPRPALRLLLGDLAWPPGERQAATLSPTIDQDTQVLREAVARNLGKRWFNAARHRLADRDAAELAYGRTGATLFVRGPEPAIYLTATAALDASFLRPGYSVMSQQGGTVPLCPLIIAGRNLALARDGAGVVMSIYDRRDDVAIRAKNAWGAIAALLLHAILDDRDLTMPTYVSVTTTETNATHVDVVTLDHELPDPCSLEQALEVLGRAHAEEGWTPYLRDSRP